MFSQRKSSPKPVIPIYVFSIKQKKGTLSVGNTRPSERPHLLMGSFSIRCSVEEAAPWSASAAGHSWPPLKCHSQFLGSNRKETKCYPELQSPIQHHPTARNHPLDGTWRPGQGDLASALPAHSWGLLDRNFTSQGSCLHSEQQHSRDYL